MATFKPLLRGKPRQDNTYNVKIRLTHNRESIIISTQYYVHVSEVTKALKIKNQSVLDKINDQIKEYRRRADRYNIAPMSVREVFDIISKEEERFKLDFLAYGRAKAEKMKPGTARSYNAALKVLSSIVGDSLMIENLTLSTLNAMKANIIGKGLVRAPSLYMNCIKNIFTMACEEFNGENIDDWKIRHNPFRGFNMPQERLVENRALSLEQIKELIDLPYIDRFNTRTFSRFNIAKDCYVLSLGLMGMNSADLYSCDNIENGVITYKRQKTTDKRKDNALMKVKIEPEISKLVDKYRGEERVFCFYRYYSTSNAFNQCINKGLRQVKVELNERLKRKGIPQIEGDLHYYSARHSMASIAQNKAGINKYLVGEMLNHSLEGTLRITDRYTKKDWGRIWDANRKTLSVIFDKEYNCEHDHVKAVTHSKSGHVGVYETNGRFRAVYSKNGNHSVGSFATLEEAVKAREKYIEDIKNKKRPF